MMLPAITINGPLHQRIIQLATISGLTPQHVCGALAFWLSDYHPGDSDDGKVIAMRHDALMRQMRSAGLSNLTPQDLAESRIVEVLPDGLYRVHLRFEPAGSTLPTLPAKKPGRK